MMMFDLAGKKAFITGGASGIGRGVADRFVVAGATVAIADFVDGADVANDIGATYLPINVADEQSVSSAFAMAEDKFGKLDIVVNNAGVGDIGPTFEATDAKLIEKLTLINQNGVLYGLKYAPRHMNDNGSIINTSSMAAYVNMPGTGVYSATKAAVVSMTRMSALELGHRGIRVNAVCPAYIDTAMSGDEESYKLAEAFTAMGRMGTVADVVGLFHFLAADESRYFTGQALKLDGGWTSGPAPQLLERIIGKKHTG